MILDIIFIFFLVIITFLPILFWGYLFSYFDWNDFNKKLFYTWIFVWWFSVFPVLYLDDILRNWLWFLNFFQNILHIFSFSWFLLFFISIFLFAFIIWIFYLFLFAWFDNIKIKLKKFLRGFYFFIPIFFLFSLFILLISLFFSFFSWLDFKWEWLNMSFWEVIFNTFKLVIFYYLLMAFLEEISKYLWFKYSSYSMENISLKQSVLFWVFVALGFSFIENILYFYNLYNKSGLWLELIVSYFLRSILSISVHILSTTIFVYFFSKFFNYSAKLYDYKMIYYLFIWFLLSVSLHAIYNIWVTFNITLLSFSYIFLRYFYLTYIFNEE